jgi:hypothetical protein
MAHRPVLMKTKPTTIAARLLAVTALGIAAIPASAQTPGHTGPPARAEAGPAQDPGTQPSAPGKDFKLPGITIDAKQRHVDVQASVCLDEGALELIACTKDSKEHESIVVVEARPIHIHTALLLLGAKNGNPPMRQPLNEEMTRWADVPPQGDLIEVFLEFKDAAGKLTERPISDFIARSDDDHAPPAAGETDAEPKPRFPHTFIFAGSMLRENESGPKDYLADRSGHVISIASFGDEVLCLPDHHSQDNGALMWRIDSTHLPKPGTPVTLRLRFKKEPAPKPDP